jgi:hypothetical protein
VEGRARPVGTDREHARRGLDGVAADEQRRVDAEAAQQVEHHVAERVVADRAGAAHVRAELRERDRGPAGGAGRGDPDLLDELAALTSRDLLDRANEHVDDVHPQRHHFHRFADPARACVVP